MTYDPVIGYQFYSKVRPKSPAYVKGPKPIHKGSIMPNNLPLFADYTETVDGAQVTYHNCPLRLTQDEYGGWIVTFHAEDCSVVTWR